MSTREKYVVIEGIVLKHHTAQEQDVILQVLSREKGKLPLLARGLLKAQSKLAGTLEPLQRAQINLVQGKQLYVVTGAVLTESYKDIRSDYRKTLCAVYFGDLLDRLLEEGAPEPGLFDFLDHSLRLASRVSPAVLCFYFEWRLLNLLGYGISSLDCAGCGVSFGAGGAPSPVVPSGHLICRACAKNQGVHSPALQAEDRAVLRVFSQGSEDLLSSLYLTEDQVHRLARYFALRFQDLLTRPLKSREILFQMI